MTDSYQHTAVLMLEDGTVYKGHAVGHKGTTTGEICFNTGMTGYQEVFTDPSYYGQVMVTTHVHIGNYGTLDEDDQSDQVQIAGLICKDFREDFSRQRSDLSIQDYFDQQQIVGIEGVDTRAIVRHIRSQGAMNCIISSTELDESKLRDQLSKTPSMDGLELSSKVTTQATYELGDPHAEVRIAVMDYGTKRNILKCMTDRGAHIRVFPGTTSAKDVLAWKPDGVFLSNGPGDPATMDYAIQSTQQLMETGKPMFGICLGHQILALAMGIPTYKMHHGHRGINHPVKNVLTGKCEITSQNHGFGVSPEALAGKSELVEVTHINLNDDTVEGIQHRELPIFSVQYHPEAAPGPHDSRYLFDQFISNIKAHKA